MIEIAIKNFSTSVTDAEVRAALPAFQRQVSEDYRSVYGGDAKLEWFDKNAAVPGGLWQLYSFESADQAGYLGFHDKTKNGLPIGKNFLGTTKKFGGIWSVTFSHELLEMLADPWVNLSVVDEKLGRAWNFEIADAVEADELGYTINGVQVSDFVKPGYFEPEVASVSKGRSFCNHVTKAFELAPGGYMGFWDFATKSFDQVDARKAEHHAGEAGRFARRQVKHHDRRASTAE